MLQFPSPKRTRPTVHLTALIDIVFLLLIFFLLTSNFVEQEGVAIIAPEVQSKGTDSLPDTVVTIDHNGVITLDGIVFGEQRLAEALRHQLEKTSNDTVVIQADRRVQYDTVVQVIDIAKQAGARNFLLVTQRTPE